jgi:hypothetical protein
LVSRKRRHRRVYVKKRKNEGHDIRGSTLLGSVSGGDGSHDANLISNLRCVGSASFLIQTAADFNQHTDVSMNGKLAVTTIVRERAS